jgi:hypothetical protein
MRLEGVIRKWVPEGHWGIVHSYSRGSNSPEKFFVHASKASEGAVLDIAVRISFVAGPPRRKGDLPAALEIEVVPARTLPAPVDSSTGSAR